ncbi:hypothetical protein QEK83_002440 [Stenotrophomonas maltophilia]|uniref:Uncharacterized protein n=1 Tax=Stenotrophomonas maltophilia TaxID=40324 RepID=A0AAI9G0G2_STEMA|nr:hypothetical protein [Stenotrophomonas maltophilia]
MSADLLAIGVDTALDNCAHYLREEQGLTDAAAQIDAVRVAFASVRAAARAYRASSDLVDVIVTGDRLDAALAACEPTDPHNDREAVDGLCVEENDDEQ